MHNNITQKSPNVFSRETESQILLKLIFQWQTRARLSDAFFQCAFLLIAWREAMTTVNRRGRCLTRGSYIRKRSFLEKISTDSLTLRRRGSSDAIVGCTIWLAGATVLWSRLRLRPDVSAPARSNRALGGHEDRKVEVVAHRTYCPKSRTQLSKERLPPYLASSATTETAAAVGSDTLEGGDHPVGESRRTPAPHVPSVRFVRGERIFEVRARIPRKISRWFTIRAAAELSRSSAKNGLCL